LKRIVRTSFFPDCSTGKGAVREKKEPNKDKGVRKKRDAKKARVFVREQEDPLEGQKKKDINEYRPEGKSRGGKKFLYHLDDAIYKNQHKKGRGGGETLNRRKKKKLNSLKRKIKGAVGEGFLVLKTWCAYEKAGKEQGGGKKKT